MRHRIWGVENSFFGRVREEEGMERRGVEIGDRSEQEWERRGGYEQGHINCAWCRRVYMHGAYACEETCGLEERGKKIFQQCGGVVRGKE